MNRSKIVAVVTGAIAIFLSVVYLLLVQFLDLRGEMVPAPISDADEPGVESPIVKAPLSPNFLQPSPSALAPQVSQE